MGITKTALNAVPIGELLAVVIIKPRLGQEKCRAREMACGLRALAILAEDPDTVPTTHTEAHHYLKLQF